MEKQIKIIFEDDYLMVIDKPDGVVATEEGRTNEQITVEDWSSRVMKVAVERGGVVHRLDKDTTGLLLVAKKSEVWRKLKGQFKRRQVEKKYLALASGDLPLKGQINVPVGRSKYVFGKFGVRPEGKAAMTCFSTLAKYRMEGRIYSLIEVNLVTGRTHQIRVHMSYMGWPLAGDRNYGGKEVGGLKRQFLHAYKISFDHPMSGEKMSFESQLPDDLKELINKSEKV